MKRIHLHLGTHNIWKKIHCQASEMVKYSPVDHQSKDLAFASSFTLTITFLIGNKIRAMLQISVKATLKFKLHSMDGAKIWQNICKHEFIWKLRVTSNEERPFEFEVFDRTQNSNLLIYSVWCFPGWDQNDEHAQKSTAESTWNHYQWSISSSVAVEAIINAWNAESQ